MDNKQGKKAPEILCELVYTIDSKDYNPILSDVFTNMGFINVVGKKPKAMDVIDYDLATTGYIEEWRFDEVLNKLFDIIGDRTNNFTTTLEEYKGKTFMSAAFYAHNDNPELYISKENIARLASLRAGIDIDAYWTSVFVIEETDQD